MEVTRDQVNRLSILTVMLFLSFRHEQIRKEQENSIKAAPLVVCRLQSFISALAGIIGVRMIYHAFVSLLSSSEMVVAQLLEE